MPETPTSGGEVREVPAQESVLHGGEHISVLFPWMVRGLGELTTVADLVRDGTAHRLWLGQSLTVESHHALAYLAGAGYRIPVGLSVALMALRHPFDAAAQARSLAILTGHPPVIGYGAAEPEFAAALHGARYARPASAVAEYISVLRRLLDGDALQHRGPLFTADQVNLPPVMEELLPDPVAEVGAGVLRPGMARAAGRTADVAISWLTPPDYVRDVLIPALSAGAEAAGRTDRPRVVTVVHAAVARQGRSPLILAQLGAGNHLRVPHYADMLRRAGLDVDVSDPVCAARELVEEGVFLYGKPGDVAAGIRRHFAAGIDEVVVNPLAVAQVHGLDAALADLREILAEFA
ncbi:LLM class flavin-dependent oxidoreductase [Streptomyces sp. NPDC048290]|uniref:LLM class flavin-dependent oxidoreductase n=1 Tax=Streptomyces sp. NPDC048290 TaxID=3155811 RepID=UPI00341EE17F